MVTTFLRSTDKIDNDESRISKEMEHVKDTLIKNEYKNNDVQKATTTRNEEKQ